jgi:(p)ppGpp synthase/HD superfamily hydrolase
MLTDPITLTQRFENALVYAYRLHATQLRADGQTPYIAHLMSVAALVLEIGGDEDEAIAALLHDAIEDQGGEKTRQRIQQEFGDRVTQIVEGCTEMLQQPPLSWRNRKLQYLEQLRYASSSVQRVVLADKLHNLRSLLASFQQDGAIVWSRFNRGQAETLWFYRAVWNILRAGEENYWIQLYGQVLGELERLSTP